jgi:hypothetical protein
MGGAGVGELRSKGALVALALVPIIALGGVLYLRGPSLNGIRLAVPPGAPNDGHDDRGHRFLVDQQGTGSGECADALVVYADRALTIEGLRRRLAGCPNATKLTFAYEDEDHERRFVATTLVAPESVSAKNSLIVASLGPKRLGVGGKSFDLPMPNNLAMWNGPRLHYALRAEDSIEHTLELMAVIERNLASPASASRTIALHPVYAPPATNNEPCTPLSAPQTAPPSWSDVRAKFASDCAEGHDVVAMWDCAGYHALQKGYVTNGYGGGIARGEGNVYYDSLTDRIVGSNLGRCLGVVPTVSVACTPIIACEKKAVVQQPARPSHSRPVEGKVCECQVGDPLCGCND